MVMGKGQPGKVISGLHSEITHQGIAWSYDLVSDSYLQKKLVWAVFNKYFY